MPTELFAQETSLPRTLLYYDDPDEVLDWTPADEDEEVTGWNPNLPIENPTVIERKRRPTGEVSQLQNQSRKLTSKSQ